MKDNLLMYFNNNNCYNTYVQLLELTEEMHMQIQLILTLSFHLQHSCGIAVPFRRAELCEAFSVIKAVTKMEK